MNLLQNVMFLLLTIPLVTVSLAMKLLENVNNTSCHCFSCNETIRKCDVLLLTIPLYCFYCNETITKCDVLLLTIPLVTVSIAMKLLENVKFCF